jgi:hypothetical protein
MFYNHKFILEIWVNSFFCYFVGNYFRERTPFRRWLCRHANEVWIHILAATWQIANQNASSRSRGCNVMHTITWTAGGIFSSQSVGAMFETIIVIYSADLLLLEAESEEAKTWSRLTMYRECSKKNTNPVLARSISWNDVSFTWRVRNRRLLLILISATRNIMESWTIRDLPLQRNDFMSPEILTEWST